MCTSAFLFQAETGAPTTYPDAVGDQNNNTNLFICRDSQLMIEVTMHSQKATASMLLSNNNEQSPSTACVRISVSDRLCPSACSCIIKP